MAKFRILFFCCFAVFIYTFALLICGYAIVESLNIRTRNSMQQCKWEKKTQTNIILYLIFFVTSLYLCCVFVAKNKTAATVRYNVYSFRHGLKCWLVVQLSMASFFIYKKTIHKHIHRTIEWNIPDNGIPYFQLVFIAFNLNFIQVIKYQYLFK